MKKFAEGFMFFGFIFCMVYILSLASDYDHLEKKVELLSVQMDSLKATPDTLNIKNERSKD